MRTAQTQTYTIEQVAERLGIARGMAYRAARENTLPVPVIRVGRRLLVSKAALDALLAATAADVT